MGFIDYLLGQRLSLASDLPPNQVMGRLQAAIGMMWMPFETGVVGWTWFGHFALRYYRSAWFRREWLPVLAGHVRAHGAGSRIVMLYRAPRTLLLLLLFWLYLVLLLIRNGGVLAPIFMALLLLGSAAVLVGMIGIGFLL